nr:uncharacterized protein LOC129266505 [Lytechinus pictus]
MSQGPPSQVQSSPVPALTPPSPAATASSSSPGAARQLTPPTQTNTPVTQRARMQPEADVVPELPPSVAEHPVSDAQHWVDAVSSASDWSEFETVCDRFVIHAVAVSRPNLARPQQQVRQRPGDHPPRQQRGQHRPTFDVREASRIQKLYRTSKKRAIRHILKEKSPSFSGSESDVLDFFREVYSAREVDEEAVGNLASSLFDVPQGDDSATSLSLPTSAKEIGARLSRMTNSAPGKDRLEYRHIRRADGSFRITEAIFNKCLAESRIPAPWKMASTILLHKAGPTEDPANFRPIALQSCLYKLFMAVLADRLTKWACENQYLSPEQKSARPCEGCLSTPSSSQLP